MVLKSANEISHKNATYMGVAKKQMAVSLSNVRLTWNFGHVPTVIDIKGRNKDLTLVWNASFMVEKLCDGK